jgi:hypothetical protein
MSGTIDWDFFGHSATPAGLPFSQGNCGAAQYSYPPGSSQPFQA